jgi:hypothetical protein
MHRRGFILSACAAMHFVGPSRARSAETGPNRSEGTKPTEGPKPTEGNVSVFQDLANLFKELSNIFAASTDAATKGFRGVAEGTRREPRAVIRASTIFFMQLEHEPCSLQGKMNP